MTRHQRKVTMSKIHSRNTSPECRFRLSLFRLGYRYRKNVKQLPGCPDIVMRKYRTVVFINGCFWHCHQGCIKATMPNTNRTYWKDKLQRNVSRDISNSKMLEDMGWNVVTVWECEIKRDLSATVGKVVDFLNYQSDCKDD